MGPDWLGSPQHFVAGVVVAAVIVVVARRWTDRWWLLLTLAVGATMTAETLVELAEYPLLYSDDPHVTAYWDTLADLAATLVGALVGAGVALAVRARRSARPAARQRRPAHAICTYPQPAERSTRSCVVRTEPRSRRG